MLPRSLRCTPGWLAGLTLLLSPLAGWSQGTPEEVTFEAVDEIELHGTYYPSDKGTNAPCAILLHELGGSRKQPGWAELATALQSKGYAVLTFDFRGHGASKKVSKYFWKAPANERFPEAKKRAGQFVYNDRDRANWPIYVPMLVNDIAAARRFLDLKNDARQCNSRNLVLIGAEEGAALATLWVDREWGRRGRGPTAAQPSTLGQDVIAVVCLSISPFLGNHKNVPADSWIRPQRDRTPMAFLYGEDDSDGAKRAEQLVEKVLRVDVPPRVKLTGAKAVAGTKAEGHELLRPNLGTIEYIINYLSNVMDSRDESPWLDRGTKKSRLNFVPLGGNFKGLPGG